MEGTTMATLLTSLGEVVTAVLGYIPEITDAIMASPILLLSMGFFIIGGSIAIFGRLLSRG